MPGAPLLVALRLDGLPCLVVGSGGETAGRCARLLEAGAVVSVVAERPDTATLRLASEGKVTLARRRVRDQDLDGKWLAVLCDRTAPLARHLASAAAARRVLFCAVDGARGSGFSHVAVSRAGSLQIGVSTDGRAPALARKLRQEIDRLLADANAADRVDRLAALRDRTSSEQRARVLGEAVEAVRLTGCLELPAPEKESD